MPSLAAAAMVALCLTGEPPLAPIAPTEPIVRMPSPPFIPTPRERIRSRPTPEELDRIYDELAEVLRIMARKGFGLHEWDDGRR